MTSTISLNELKYPVIGDPSTWASTNANTVVGYLLEKMLPGLTDEIRRDSFLFQMFAEDKAQQWKGGVARFHVNFRRDNSMHVTRDAGPIRRGNHPKPVRGQVTEKFFVAEMELTDGALASVGGGDMTEIIDTLQFLLEGQRDDFKENLSREMYLDGTGVLFTTLDASPVTDGVDMTEANGSAQYVYEDMEVEVWNAARTVQRGTFFVTDVEPSTGTISLTDTQGGTPGNNVPTLTNGDVVCRIGTQDGTAGFGNLLGLAVHVDDGTNATVHESIDRDTYNEWKSLVVDGTGALTSRNLHKLFRGVKVASRHMPKMGLMNDWMFVEYAELFQPTVQSSPGGAAMLGFENAVFKSGDATFQFKVDDAAPFDTIWALNPDTFKFLMKKSLGPRAQHLDTSASAMGGAQFQAARDQLVYAGTLLMIGELICTACRRNGKLENVTTDPEVRSLV